MKKIYNGLMGLIVGDAVGAPVEFLERDSFHLTGMVGYGSHNVPPGTWTDDSAMALATVESIARLGVVDANDIMHNFALWLTKAEFTPYGRTFGVGNTVMRALLKYLDGTPAEQCGCPNRGDNGNGALMRILPLAYTDCDDAIIDTVSGLTHAHEISQTACRIYIEIARWLLQGYKLRQVLHKYEIFPIAQKELQRIPAIENCSRDQISSSGYVVDTLEAALWSLLHSNNYRECILTAANLGGDSDTTCAVAGGLAGIIYGIGGEKGIPEGWIAEIVRKDWIAELCESFNKERQKALPILTPEEQERMKFIESCGIYDDEELDEMRNGLIKNIRIEENKNTGFKQICYCFGDGGVYREISIGPTPKGGDYADAYYYDKKHKLTSRETAYWIDIHEMCFDGRMLGTVWGMYGPKYDVKKWMKRKW